MSLPVDPLPRPFAAELNVLCCAAWGGVLSVAQKLSACLRPCLSKSQVARIIHCASQQGQLTTVKWLIMFFRPENDSHDYLWGFETACYGGHLSTAQFLAEYFKFTTDAVRACFNSTFLRTCANGHLDVAQWLASTYRLTRDDVCDHYNEAFRRACSNNHLPVAIWLADTFGITFEDRVKDAFVETCLSGYPAGNPAVVLWLIERFDLVARIRQARCVNADELMAGVCERGNLPVAQLLATHFEIKSPAFISNSGWFDLYVTCAHSAALKHGHLDVAQWLVEYFELEAPEFKCTLQVRRRQKERLEAEEQRRRYAF